jgi:hypothetical protein
MTGRMHVARLAAEQLRQVVAATAGPGPGSSLIGRRAAHELARRELARSIYQPDIFERIIDWLQRLLNGAGGAIPGGWFGLVALAALAVLVISSVLYWVRPARSRWSPSSAVRPRTDLSARDHRARAERLAADGNFSGAIVERTRAIAAELEERGIVPARPGRTADELAAEAGPELPDLARELRRAMGLFDDVLYGDRPGTEAGYQQVSLTDREVRSARPTASPGPRATPAGFGVPR